jgi:hypothetical protein
MPGSMIHLLSAYSICENTPDMLFLGSIAPDAVSNRETKEHTHFRNLDDRRPALIELAKKTKGNFAEGMLLHLYLDWRWDTYFLKRFIAQTDDDWFPAYRNEIQHAGAYAFHHTAWAADIWKRIDEIAESDYGEIPSATSAELKDFVSRNRIWHENNSLAPSSAFPPDEIAEFIAKTAKEYIDWRKSV